MEVNKDKMKINLICLISLLLISLAPAVFAQDIENSPELFGIELELLLGLINSIVSLILFIITFLAFKRDGRDRLLYVSIAFLIFSIKSFLVSLELFVEIGLIDPIAVILEFVALMSFFIGVFKK